MDRTVFRLQDILTAISDINILLQGKTFDAMYQDRATRAAFERFLEIISEASRHIPDDLKALRPEIPWRNIGNMGNHLRHAYHRVDIELLWTVYERDLPPLTKAIKNLVARATPPQT